MARVCNGPLVGFAFVQVPNGIEGLIVDGQESVPAIAVTVCGQHYRVAGLAYRLKHPPRLTAQDAGPGSPGVYPLPLISIPPPGVGAPQTDGLRNQVRAVSTEPTRALLASGAAWSIELIFGVAGDGSTQLVTPRVVADRRYAAFVIGTSLRLERLTWIDAAGKAFASTTSLPRSGYTQFQP